MAYTDIFEAVPVPGGIPTSTSKLMQLGISVMRHANTTRSRRKSKVEKIDPIESSNGEFSFPAVTWQKQYDREIYLTIVDKRRARAGLLITAFAKAARNDTEHTAVQAFYVSDELSRPYRGLRRVLNDAFADDVAAHVLEAQHASIVRERLDAKPEGAQLVDYGKIISTVITELKDGYYVHV